MNQVITTEGELETYINEQGQFKKTGNDVTVIETIFEGLQLANFDLLHWNFHSCKFLNCYFTKVEFNGTELKDVTFQNCHFENMTFMDCSLSDCIMDGLTSGPFYFGMTALENTIFEDGELQFVSFSDCLYKNLTFNKTWLSNAKFESGDHFYLNKCNLYFRNANLQSVVFIDLDLTCSIFSTSGTTADFVNCILSAKSIEKNALTFRCGIDFSTIKNSENLPKSILELVFGITEKNIKDKLCVFTAPPTYYSAFISYSFVDAPVAIELNRCLVKNGVKTFLWENDAPGGRKLKKIMADNIRKHDKFLFVASENSLRSEACQYEISEAREKYYKSWSDIFLPIHIDQYLFEVRREDIPNKFVNKYWENIEELKNVHSLDFRFSKNIHDIECNNKFEKLINALKIKDHGNAL